MEDALSEAGGGGGGGTVGAWRCHRGEGGWRRGLKRRWLGNWWSVRTGREGSGGFLLSRGGGGCLGKCRTEEAGRKRRGWHFRWEAGVVPRGGDLPRGLSGPGGGGGWARSSHVIRGSSGAFCLFDGSDRPSARWRPSLLRNTGRRAAVVAKASWDRQPPPPPLVSSAERLHRAAAFDSAGTSPIPFTNLAVPPPRRFQSTGSA